MVSNRSLLVINFFAKLICSVIVYFLFSKVAWAQNFSGFGLPALTTATGSDGEITYSLSLQILLLMTALTVLPSLVLGMTAFTRIIIVLSILRQALGTQQTPPNQVLIAIALFLSFYIMNPIFELIYFETITPYMDGKLSAEVALDQGLSVLKEFMVSNTRVDTLNMFSKLSDVGPFEDKQSVPISIVLPAFITSELKTAFEIGFLIFLPFLVIDMVIASILMSLGMMMLSPMLISLPFKLLLFVLVDGWAMTVGSLSKSCFLADYYDRWANTRNRFGNWITNRFDPSSYINSRNDFKLCTEAFCSTWRYGIIRNLHIIDHDRLFHIYI
jgi:flagellar biosynthetic protein FliP